MSSLNDFIKSTILVCLSALGGWYAGYFIAQRDAKIELQNNTIALERANQDVLDRVVTQYTQEKIKLNSHIESLVNENTKINDNLDKCLVSNERLQHIRKAHLQDAKSTEHTNTNREYPTNLTCESVVNYSIELVGYARDCKAKQEGWIKWYKDNGGK